ARCFAGQFAGRGLGRRRQDLAVEFGDAAVDAGGDVIERLVGGQFRAQLPAGGGVVRRRRLVRRRIGFRIHRGSGRGLRVRCEGQGQRQAGEECEQVRRAWHGQRVTGRGVGGRVGGRMRRRTRGVYRAASFGLRETSRAGADVYAYHAHANSTNIVHARPSLSTMPNTIPIHVPKPTFVARPKRVPSMPRPCQSSPTSAPTKGPANSPTGPKNSPTTVPTTAPTTALRLAPTRFAPAAVAQKSITIDSAVSAPRT